LIRDASSVARQCCGRREEPWRNDEETRRTTLGAKVMALSLRSGQLKELVNPIRAAM
jgi:hypothetical protein